MHIRLLTEEAVCMVHGIMDDFKGYFWLESKKTDKGLLCRVCISAEKSAEDMQEEELLAVSTSGRNENARGFMGKIRELVRISVQKSSPEEQMYIDRMIDSWWNMGVSSTGNIQAAMNCWSLRLYREKLAEEKMNDTEAWDELEKSIVANLADEVKVWLRRSSTDVVIEKLFV